MGNKFKVRSNYKSKIIANKSSFFIVVFLLTTFLSIAQTNDNIYFELVYADSLQDITVVDENNLLVNPSFGMKLFPTTRIFTKNTSVELRIIPNSSIVRIAPNSSFSIDSLEGYNNSNTTSVGLVGGKFRMIAAKTVGNDSYKIKTPSAVGGVRGTDFVVLVEEGLEDSIYVSEGLVEFIKDDSTESLLVSKGKFANALEEDFSIKDFDFSKMVDVFNDLSFTFLSPMDVISEIPSEVLEVAKSEKTELEEPVEKEPTITRPETIELPEEIEKEKKETKKKSSSKLGEFLGFELGSITISGKTYSKATVQPEFSIGKLKMSLYLPIIYTSDIFNPNDWYKPAGNNEWSFGFDQDNVIDGAKDALIDIALKIKYLEFGEQGVDPFFVKLGNLDSLTLGHGSLVKNFSNNYEFPSIRKLGFSTGVQINNFGFETILDDIADVRLAGLRLAYGNKGPAIGISGVVDIDPCFDYNDDEVENPYLDFGSPFIVGTGLDFQLFNLNLGIFTIKTYLDVGTIFPVFRNPPIVQSGDSKINEGLSGEVLLDYLMNNYLGTLGISGKLLGAVNYELEYRLSQGLAKVALFDTNWNRMRGAYIQEWHDYLRGETKDLVDGKLDMGVYGSLGADIFGFVQIVGAYYWPWAIQDKKVETSRDDKLDLSLSIPKGKIPFIRLHGSIYYSRKDFAYSLYSNFDKESEEKIHLFDANTIFGGEIVYGIAEGLDLAINVFTSTIYDEDGNLIYENNKPAVRPVISFETRISF